MGERKIEEEYRASSSFSRRLINPTLEIQDLKFSYSLEDDNQRMAVLGGVSFDVPAGGYCSIIGPSGCGKSTLLQCSAGLIQAYKGKVTLEDMHPESVRAKHLISFVFQKPVFFEWKTILENVALPAQVAEMQNVESAAMEYLGLFQIDTFAHAFPHELSGGMLSRAAMARALITQPSYLVLDEAFNHLDESLRDRINHDIQTYWMSNHPTVLAVTHSISEAVLMSDSVVVLSKKPARVIDRIEIPLDRPRSADVLSTTLGIKLISRIRSALERAYMTERE